MYEGASSELGIQYEAITAYMYVRGKNTVDHSEA
jgi:hypothetical protein